VQFSVFGLAFAAILKKSASLRLGPFIAVRRANYFTGGVIVIGSKAIDRDRLFARLNDIKSSTKSSIEISRRLIDESFLRFNATHRNLYAAQRLQERLKALPLTRDSAAASRELSHLATPKEHPKALHPAEIEADSTCDHCEGTLLNNKAYRVRSHDDGLILLDMVVCYACNLEAKNLGLKSDEL
jgi:hypothetical protein